MFKVIHYDYNPSLAAHLYKLNLEFGVYQKHPDIEYTFFNPLRNKSDVEPWMIDPISELEKVVDQYDVLLIHPGIDAQKKIMVDFPAKFPNLKICIVSPCPEDYYERNGTVTVLPFREKDVIEYVLRMQKEKQQKTDLGK
jgi:hypothetical protein